MCAIVPVCRNSSQMPQCGIPVAASIRFGQAAVFSDCALYAGFQPSRHNIGFDAAIGLKDAIKEKIVRLFFGHCQKSQKLLGS